MHELPQSETHRKKVGTLALFPLGTVLLPGCQLELRIFEPRYLSLVHDCIASDTGFGVVRIEEGAEALREPDARQPSISPVGCQVRVIDHIPMPSGQMLIRILACQRFEVLSIEEQADRLLLGRVCWLKEEEIEAIPKEFDHLIRILSECVEGQPQIAEEIDIQDASEVSWWLTRLRVQDAGPSTTASGMQQSPRAASYNRPIDIRRGRVLKWPLRN